MGGADLSTTIGRPTGSAGFDGNGMAIYRNKNTVSLKIIILQTTLERLSSYIHSKHSIV